MEPSLAVEASAARESTYRKIPIGLSTPAIVTETAVFVSTATMTAETKTSKLAEMTRALPELISGVSPFPVERKLPRMEKRIFSIV